MLVVNSKPELKRIIDGKHYGSVKVFDPKSNLSTDLKGPMYALHHILKACTKVKHAGNGKEVLCLEYFAIITDEKGDLIVVSSLDR